MFLTIQDHGIPRVHHRDGSNPPPRVVMLSFHLWNSWASKQGKARPKNEQAHVGCCAFDMYDIGDIIWFTIISWFLQSYASVCNCKKQRDISGWIRIEWILLLIFHQLSFSWPFRGFWGGTPLEKCPAQDATSEGAFQRCRLFHLDSSIFRYSWPLGQRSEYLRSQRHGAAHWLPRNKCLSCVKWLAFFHSRDWNTPTSVLTKFNKIRFWGALVRQK